MNHKQQRIRTRQIVQTDGLPDRQPLTDLSDIDSGLSRRRLFVAQLDNQPQSRQREVMDAWQAHLKACEMFQRFRRQVCDPTADDLADLAFWRGRVVETAEACLALNRPQAALKFREEKK